MHSKWKSLEQKRVEEEIKNQHWTWKYLFRRFHSYVSIFDERFSFISKTENSICEIEEFNFPPNRNIWFCSTFFSIARQGFRRCRRLRIFSFNFSSSQQKKNKILMFSSTRQLLSHFIKIKIRLSRRAFCPQIFEGSSTFLVHF